MVAKERYGYSPCMHASLLASQPRFEMTIPETLRYAIEETGDNSQNNIDPEKFCLYTMARSLKLKDHV
jgi:hypothetical protein